MRVPTALAVLHLSLLVAPSLAGADPGPPAAAASSAAESHRNEVRVGAGFAYSRDAPDFGVPLVVHYGRALGARSLWLVVRGTLVLNAAGPDGQAMKNGAGGLDLGIEWHAGPSERAHLYLGGAVGGQVYAFPGYGGGLRVCLGLRSSLTRTGWGAFVEAAGLVAVSRLGDEAPATRLQGRAELVAGMSYRF